MYPVLVIVSFHGKDFLLRADDCYFFFPVIRLSFDEGRSWSKYSFTSIPLFVDGVLGEPGEETLIMT